MILYLDTSAAVKLYASESGSAETRRAVAQAEQIASSLLAYAETRAALARKYRMRQIDASGFERSKADFESDWRGFIKMPADPETVRRAGDFAEQFRLRAYDAIHLATADRLYRETRSRVVFACFDRVLNRAASTLGLILAAS
ncbi:MAG: type II toxin-antitoxin system VapC family toxin [Candidatus Binataceae bacterium]